MVNDLQEVQSLGQKCRFARIFAALQAQEIITIQVEVLAIDSASCKVHPDGHGVLKTRKASYRQVKKRLEYQASCSIRR